MSTAEQWGAADRVPGRGLEQEVRGILNLVLRGAGISFLGRLMGSAVQYGYHVVLARFLGAGHLGVYALGTGVVEVAGTIARVGLDRALLKFIPTYTVAEEGAKIKGLVASCLAIVSAIGCVVAIAVYNAAGLVAQGFSKPELAAILRPLALAVPLTAAMGTILYALQGRYRFAAALYTEHALPPVASCVVALPLLWWGYGIEAAVWAFLLASVLGLLASLYFLWHAFPELSRAMPYAPLQQELVRFAWAMFVTLLAYLPMMWAHIFLLGVFAQAREVGIYSVAVRTAYVITVIITGFNSTFTPLIAELYRKGEVERLAATFQTITKWTFAAALAAFLPLLLLAPEVMGLFGEEFVVGALPLMVLAFSQLVNAATGPTQYVLMMAGNERIVMYDCIVALLLNVGGCLLLIPRFGMLGAACGTGAAAIALNLLLLVQTYSLTGMQPYTLRYLKVLRSAAIATVCTAFLKHLCPPPSLAVVCHGVFFLVAYGLLLLWGRDAEDEIVGEVLRMGKRIF